MVISEDVMEIANLLESHNWFISPGDTKVKIINSVCNKYQYSPLVALKKIDEAACYLAMSKIDAKEPSEPKSKSIHLTI